jgi:hypothetical protein
MADSRTSRWADLLGVHVPVVLTLSGILLYVLLSAPYALFYYSLGIGLNDVGLTYTTILASSVGSIVIALMFIAAVTVVIWAILEKLWKNSDKRARFWVSFGASIVLILGVFLPITALANANQVKNGDPIERTFLAAPAIHANSVRVTSTAEDGKTITEIRQLSSKNSLLYLGKSNGTLVLYDPTVDEAIYVPAPLVTLRIKN